MEVICLIAGCTEIFGLRTVRTTPLIRQILRSINAVTNFFRKKADAMELVKGIQLLTHSLSHAVVTIGNFDGVHLGHQKIIDTAVKKARDRKGQCVAYTFRPHPQVALRPAAHVQLLSTYDEKIELLGRSGIDVVIEEPFSREFSSIEPEQFFSDILLHRLSVEAVVVGYDFAFGKERHGHLESLESLCKGASIELTVVEPHRSESEVVSSSKIREHLGAGRIEAANRLLGYSFFYRGVVVKGEGRGRKLGFPTANLKLENKLTLPYGVYATLALFDGKLFPSVTNIGIRPTFQTGEKELPVLVETHLIQSYIDMYGANLEVRFIGKLREEQKFSSVDQLKTQISIDIEKSSRFFQLP